MATTAPPKIFKLGNNPLKINVDPSSTDSFAIMRALTKGGAMLATRMDEASVIIVNRRTSEANATFSAYGQDPSKRILTPGWVNACIRKERLIDGAEMERFRITDLVSIDKLDLAEDEEADEEEDTVPNGMVESHLLTPPDADLHFSRLSPNDASSFATKSNHQISPAEERTLSAPPLGTASLQPATSASSPSLIRTSQISGSSQQLPSTSTAPKPPVLASSQSNPPKPSVSPYAYAALAPKRSFNFQSLQRTSSSMSDVSPSNNVTATPKGKEKESYSGGAEHLPSSQTQAQSHLNMALQPLFTFADLSTINFYIGPGVRDLHELSALIRKHGGHIAVNISLADFALLNHNSKNLGFETSLTQAISARKPPLRPSFVHSCVEKGDIVDWHDFIVKNISSELERAGFWKESEETVSRKLFSFHRKNGDELDEGAEARVCYLLNKKFPHRHPRYFIAYREGNPKAGQSRRMAISTNTQSTPSTSKTVRFSSEAHQSPSPSRIRSPSPVIEDPVPLAGLGGGKYLFTEAENAYALKYINVLIRRDPAITPDAMALELSLKRTHHSQQSWKAQIRRKMLDEISELRGEPLGARPQPYGHPSTLKLPQASPIIGKSPVGTTQHSERVPSSAVLSDKPLSTVGTADNNRPSSSTSSSQPLRLSPPAISEKIALMGRASTSERIRSPSPKSWTPVLIGGTKFRFTPEENEYAVACIRVLIQRDLHVAEDSMAAELSQKIPTHSLLSWRAHLGRRFTNAISQIRKNPFSKLPSTPDPVSNLKIAEERQRSDKKKARIPNSTPTHDLRSPSPPTDTPVPDTRGYYRFPAAEVAWALGTIDVLLQRDADMKHVEIANALHKKLPHHSPTSWSCFLSQRVHDEYQALRDKHASLPDLPSPATSSPHSSPTPSQSSASESDAVEDALLSMETEEASPSKVPRYSGTPVAFTPTDVWNLAQYLAKGPDGNRRERWQGFEDMYPAHSWKSWAEFYGRRKGEVDRYIKVIKRSNTRATRGGKRKHAPDSGEDIGDLPQDKRVRPDSEDAAIIVSDSDD